MTADGAREIAEQIVNQQLWAHWALYLLIIVLSAIASGAASYFGAYLKRKGETLATKEDMAELQAQLRRNTETTESVKSAISVDEWTHKEYRAARRVKLEELMFALHSVRSWITLQIPHLTRDAFTEDQSSPLDTVQVLAALYFPEMGKEVDALAWAFRDVRVWLRESKTRVMQGKNTTEQLAALEQFATESEAVYKPLWPAIDAVSEKAREVMSEILALKREPGTPAAARVHG
jgi:hypothetical protein